MSEMAWKSKNCLMTILMLCGILGLPLAHAHPYDSPLEFRAHKTRDGRIIYSNIPMKCFHDGVLHCYQLHPIFPKSGAPAPSTKPRISAPSEPN